MVSFAIISQSIVSGLLMGLVFALIALGLTVIFGVMDVVNFAHGEFLMLGMYTTFWLSMFTGWDPLIFVPVSAVVIGALGVATYYLLIRYVLDGPMIAQILSTFGLMLALRHLAVVLWGPNYRSLQEGVLVQGSLRFGGFVLPIGRVGAAAVSIVAFLVIYYVMNETEFGWALKASSLHPEAAEFMGINTSRMYAYAWAIGGVAVGIAGAMLANFYYVYPGVGILFVMIAFATVALGGFGSIEGAFYAGLIIGVIQVLGGILIGSEWSNALIYLTYFGVMMIRPKGLLGW